MREDASKEAGWIGRALATAKKYSIWQMIKAVALVVVGSCAVTFSMWLYRSGPALADKVANTVTDQYAETALRARRDHDEAMVRRRDVSEEIKKLIAEAMASLSASRCFVVELHNGTNNAQGLPFYYGTMTYEETDGVADYVAEEYNQITLSRYDFPLFMHDSQTWQGTVAEFAKVDRRMSARLKSHGVTYFAMIHISGTDGDLGYFGLDWCGDASPVAEMVSVELIRVSQALSVLLDCKRRN